MVDFELCRGATAVYNDPRLTDIARKTWSQLDISRDIPMNMASEDFSYFSQSCPSFYAMAGVCPPNTPSLPPLHASNFTLDENALEPAVDAMLALIVALQERELTQKNVSASNPKTKKQHR
jgi:metal-dependent amidase/aminoacylase/carboxypeptidase family protein